MDTWSDREKTRGETICRWEKGHNFTSSCVEGQVMKRLLLTFWLLTLGSQQKGEGMERQGQCVNKHAVIDHFLPFKSQQEFSYWKIHSVFSVGEALRFILLFIYLFVHIVKMNGVELYFKICSFMFLNGQFNLKLVHLHSNELDFIMPNLPKRHKHFYIWSRSAKHRFTAYELNH